MYLCFHWQGVWMNDECNWFYWMTLTTKINITISLCGWMYFLSWPRTGGNARSLLDFLEENWMYWLCFRAFDLTLLLTWKSWIANPLNMIMKVFSLMEIKKKLACKKASTCYITYFVYWFVRFPEAKSSWCNNFEEHFITIVKLL